MSASWICRRCGLDWSPGGGGSHPAEGPVIIFSRQRARTKKREPARIQVNDCLVVMARPVAPEPPLGRLIIDLTSSIKLALPVAPRINLIGLCGLVERARHDMRPAGRGLGQGSL